MTTVGNSNSSSKLQQMRKRTRRKGKTRRERNFSTNKPKRRNPLEAYNRRIGVNVIAEDRSCILVLCLKGEGGIAVVVLLLLLFSLLFKLLCVVRNLHFWKRKIFSLFPSSIYWASSFYGNLFDKRDSLFNRFNPSNYMISTWKKTSNQRRFRHSRFVLWLLTHVSVGPWPPVRDWCWPCIRPCWQNLSDNKVRPPCFTHLRVDQGFFHFITNYKERIIQGHDAEFRAYALIRVTSESHNREKLPSF